MAIDAETFVIEFPEFAVVNTSQPAMVARALRLALTQVDEFVFGTTYQDAVFLLAAHALAMSPFGENLRIPGDPTKSLYESQFDALSNSRRPRVLVGGGFGFGGPHGGF